MKRKIFTGALPDGSWPTFRDETPRETLMREAQPKTESEKKSLEFVARLMDEPTLSQNIADLASRAIRHMAK